MGLAPYGQKNAEQTHSFIQTIKDKLVTIFEDGSIKLHQSYFSYATGLRMVPDKKWQQLRKKMRNQMNQISTKILIDY